MIRCHCRLSLPSPHAPHPVSASCDAPFIVMRGHDREEKNMFSRKHARECAHALSQYLEHAPVYSMCRFSIIHKTCSHAYSAHIGERERERERYTHSLHRTKIEKRHDDTCACVSSLSGMCVRTSSSSAASCTASCVSCSDTASVDVTVASASRTPVHSSPTQSPPLAAEAEGDAMEGESS